MISDIQSFFDSFWFLKPSKNPVSPGDYQYFNENNRVNWYPLPLQSHLVNSQDKTVSNVVDMPRVSYKLGNASWD